VDADLGTVATALYVRVDDLLRTYPERAPWRPEVGIAPKITDAEQVTLAVMAALLGYSQSSRAWPGGLSRDKFSSSRAAHPVNDHPIDRRTRSSFLNRGLTYSGNLARSSAAPTGDEPVGLVSGGNQSTTPALRS
jgi:hypothetical protein